MANESVIVSADSINPKKYEVSFDGSGGTLAGSNVLQIHYLKDSFNSEGKIKLRKALEAMLAAIHESDWPTTS